jgi:hypothetical protein
MIQKQKFADTRPPFAMPESRAAPSLSEFNQKFGKG